MTMGPPIGEPEESRENTLQRLEIVRCELEVRLSTMQRGQEHPQTLRAKLKLGAAQRAGGELDAALATLDEAYAAAEYSRDSSLRLDLGRELGLTLLATSRLAEAHELLGRMLAGTVELYGESSAEWASAAEELALALRARGDLDGALRLQRQALEVSRRALGELDPGTLLIDMNLESVTNLNRLVLPPLGTLQSSARPDPATAHGDLAAYFVLFHPRRDERNRNEFSLQDMRRGLEETAFQLTPYVSFFESALVRTLSYSHDLEELSEGYALARRVWDERRAALGTEHPQTLNSMLLVSRAAARHEPEYAIEVGREAAQTSAAVLGRGHLDTLGAYEVVANMLESHGEEEEASALRHENLRLRAADKGIFGDAQPPIENLAGALTEPLPTTSQGFLAMRDRGSATGGDLDIDPREIAKALNLPIEGGKSGENAVETGGELVRRTAHVEIDPARTIDPGEHFEVRVHLDCELVDGEGSGEVRLRTKPGTTELTLRAWLVVTRHFEIEGNAIEPLKLDLREAASPRLAFTVRALRMDEYVETYEEKPAVRVFFSYLGWPSGEVRLPVPLVQTMSESAL